MAAAEIFKDQAGLEWKVFRVSDNHISIEHPNYASRFVTIELRSTGHAQLSAQSAPPEVAAHAIKVWREAQRD